MDYWLPVGEQLKLLSINNYTINKHRKLQTQKAQGIHLTFAQGNKHKKLKLFIKLLLKTINT